MLLCLYLQCLIKLRTISVALLHLLPLLDHPLYRHFAQCILTLHSLILRCVSLCFVPILHFFVFTCISFLLCVSFCFILALCFVLFRSCLVFPSVSFCFVPAWCFLPFHSWLVFHSVSFLPCVSFRFIPLLCFFLHHLNGTYNFVFGCVAYHFIPLYNAVLLFIRYISTFSSIALC